MSNVPPQMGQAADLNQLVLLKSIHDQLIHLNSHMMMTTMLLMSHAFLEHEVAIYPKGTDECTRLRRHILDWLKLQMEQTLPDPSEKEPAPILHLS